MRYRFYTADVFTDRIFGGNQLAVFPDASGLETERMQLVAREFNFSETVFVFPPRQAAHTRRLRIFAPGMEVPFAGHPTIGTAYVLAAIGEVELDGDITRIVFEEGVGAVEVSVSSERGRPVSARLSATKPPESGPAPPIAGGLASISRWIRGISWVGSTRPRRSLAACPSCSCPCEISPPSGGLVLSGRSGSLCSPPTGRRTSTSSRMGGKWKDRTYTRMFAPAMGIDEDPATGAAATALAGYLGVRQDPRDGTLRWVVEQGIEMGRPSILEVEADEEGGVITAVRVGGAVVMVGEGSMEIPEL